MEGGDHNANETIGTLKIHDDQATWARVLYAIIGVIAFTSNLLLCLLLVKRRRQMLKKPYNILIFNLAVTDLLTGIFVVPSPRLVMLQSSFPAPRGAWGELYCRMFFNRYLILVFGKASNLTLMCLSIERWFAFVRPIQYKIAFTRPRMLKYLAVIWVLSVASKTYSAFAVEALNGRCVRNENLTEAHQQMLAVTHVLVTFVLPVIVTWGTFAHLWQKLRVSVVAAGTTNRDRARIRLLRMSVLAALFLTISWLPAECDFILSRFGVFSTIRAWSFIIAVSNSCVNPWVYCFSNPEYRRIFANLLCFWRENQHPAPVGSSLQDRAPRTNLASSPGSTREVINENIMETGMEGAGMTTKM